MWEMGGRVFVRGKALRCSWEGGGSCGEVKSWRWLRPEYWPGWSMVWAGDSLELEGDVGGDDGGRGPSDERCPNIRLRLPKSGSVYEPYSHPHPPSCAVIAPGPLVRSAASLVAATTNSPSRPSAPPGRRCGHERARQRGAVPAPPLAPARRQTNANRSAQAYPGPGPREMAPGVECLIWSVRPSRPGPRRLPKDRVLALLSSQSISQAPPAPDRPVVGVSALCSTALYAPALETIHDRAVLSASVCIRGQAETMEQYHATAVANLQRWRV
ncbi:hypothetical protein OBBRIDRAFT_466615 [Obba rivulosa]|uniref:Uncharacterized protein n=1 Tax=Obba rivulosa TaxID=1052685 RepID=A0A8E2B1K0_9APHY|nr:hypothetical protein OBBRIDRAFT_466615 [Obba rivulosa]